MKLGGGGDDHAAGGQQEGDQHPGRQVEFDQAAKLGGPAFAQQRVGEEERHVDPHGRGRRTDEDILLPIHDLMDPEIIADGPGRHGFQQGPVGAGGTEEEAEVGHKAGENF